MTIRDWVQGSSIVIFGTLSGIGATSLLRFGWLWFWSFDPRFCEHNIEENLIGGPACRRCGWTP